MALKQRYKLYDAEVAAISLWRWFASPQAAQMWLDAKARSKWWRGVTDVTHIKLIYPYMGRMSGTTKDGKIGTIQVLPESLCVPTLIHEMTHLIVWIPGNNPEKDHGKRFAGALIEAYRHLGCAETAEDMTREFNERGVVWEAYP